MSGVQTNITTRREEARRDNGQFGEQTHDDPGDVFGMSDAEATNLLTQAQRAARKAAMRWDGAGIDADDLSQEAILAVLENRSRRPGDAHDAKVGSSEPIPVAVDEWFRAAGYVRTVADRVAARTAIGLKAAPDFAGYRRYRDAVQDFTAAKERTPTPAEADSIAEQIRMGFPPRRRPSVGFHRPAHLNRTTLPEQDVLVAPSGGDDPGFEPGSAGDEALTALESRTRPGLMAARRMAFRGLAERVNAPVPPERSISEERARAIRVAVTDAGGVTVVARQIAASEETGATEALLSMFGPLTHGERTRLANIFETHPDYADELFNSAVAYATRQSVRARSRDRLPR